MKYLVLLFFLFVSIQSHARSDLAQEGAYVYDSSKSILQSISVNKDLIFDHVSSKGFEVYGPYGLYNYLDKLHIRYLKMSEMEVAAAADYPSPEEVEKELEDIHAQYPNLTQLIEIGKSVEGRKLLVMKISNHPNLDEVKPEFKYISSMHGDEITGRELMIKLIRDMLSSYGKDSELTSLIDNTEIYIMPSMNPDGSHYIQRANADGYDLNRSFPDFTTSDNKDVEDGREPEIQAIMKFQKQRNFAMSANFHGGSEVVNYMWDTQPDKHPFEGLLVQLALDYANRVDYIKNSSEFDNGITNGYQWYEVNGGMQDWSYYWHNDLQFTIELSDVKWPSYSRMDYYYEKNKDAMLQFIRDVHMGAGFKLNGANQAGTVVINQIQNGSKINLGQYTYVHSEFYKVLPPGEYNFEIQDRAGKTIKSIFVAVQKQNGQYSPNYTILN